jgi:hypothetical protein
MNRDEYRLQLLLCEVFSEDFIVNTEVYSINNKNRIDLIITNGNNSFGIEIKKPDLHTKNLVEGFWQCYNYSLTEWKGFGKIPIFYCYDRTKINQTDNFIISRLLGYKGIGFVRKTNYYGWLLTKSGDRIWSQKEGMTNKGLTIKNYCHN